jgi:hypothetical protein
MILCDEICMIKYGMLYNNGDRSGAGGCGGGGGVDVNDNSSHQVLKPCISPASQETPSGFRNPNVIYRFFFKNRQLPYSESEVFITYSHIPFLSDSF